MNIDEVIDKIKKAIRLANKTTSEGERDTALRLARRLADNNGVAFEQVAEEAAEPERDKTSIEEDDVATRTPDDVFGHACFIVKTHFGVIIMRMRQTGVRRARNRLSWIGSRLNIDIARHVYHILLRESARAYAEAKRETEAYGVKMSRASFMQGFFFALHRKLEENPLRNDLDASIRDADRKLLEYAQEHEVRMKKSGGRKAKDGIAIVAGFMAGQKVNLARPCERKGDSPLAIAGRASA